MNNGIYRFLHGFILTASNHCKYSSSICRPLLCLRNIHREIHNVRYNFTPKRTLGTASTQFSSEDLRPVYARSL